MSEYTVVDTRRPWKCNTCEVDRSDVFVYCTTARSNQFSAVESSKVGHEWLYPVFDAIPAYNNKKFLVIEGLATLCASSKPESTSVWGQRGGLIDDVRSCFTPPGSTLHNGPAHVKAHAVSPQTYFECTCRSTCVSILKILQHILTLHVRASTSKYFQVSTQHGGGPPDVGK